MDPQKFTTIGHGGMSICNPLGEAAIEAALEALSEWLPADRACILDIGCGKGELLLRMAERRDVRAIGVDINGNFLAEAREQALVRGCSLELHMQAFADYIAGRAPGDAKCDAVFCIGASHAVGAPRETPALLARLLLPGGMLLLGEGYWRRDPDPHYLAALGAARENFTDHEGNQRLGAEAGLACIHAAETSIEEFDRYEERYASSIEAHLSEHPDDPDAPEMARRIADWRAAYQQWGRETLGFGLYLFAAT